MAFTPESALSYLRRAHEQNRVGHAYLISGPPGSGKRELVHRIAELINGSFDRPGDIDVAEPESKSRRIVIEQIRALEHSLQMRSENHRRKIALIADADRLQPQAANAFLKTLEEPPRDSLLLLTTAMPETLPDTILSRCISIPLAAPGSIESTPEESGLLELLDTVGSQKGTDVRNAYSLAAGFHRLLAGVRAAISDEHAAAQKSEAARYKNTTDGAWLDDREDHFKALSESQYIQRRGRLLDLLYVWWEDVLRAKNGIERTELPAARARTAAIAERLSQPEILRRIRRVEELRDHLARNIQEALAVEVAFLRIFRF